eukprot:gene6366-6859_t
MQLIILAILCIFRAALGRTEVEVNGLHGSGGMKERGMIELVKNIPNIQREPLHYVFENLNLRQEPETLWLEFGVFRGSTINYISSHTSGEVYGFDSFLGLPEKWRDGFDKGAFHMGHLPSVHANVRLLKGWFNETLPRFLRDTHPKKISFIHIDCDLYSSTKYVFDLVKDRLSAGSVIVFDELLNYPGFDGDRGELKAFYEFVTENAVKFEWIGMNGVPLGMNGTPFEKAALKILEVGSTKKTEGKLEDVKVEELPPQATETVTVTVTASSVVSEEKKTVVEQTEKSEVITPQTLQEKMHALVKNIPNIQREPLHYVFENLNLRQEPETLWLEFGVFRGSTINYISSHTSGEVYGFDSFLGLPEKWRDGFDKGAFHMGHLPSVHANVRLLKGWFNETLPRFLRDTHPKKISFIHIDCDLYSSTKYVFDLVKDRLSAGSVIVFDELLNYPGFDGDRGELKAFYEFVTENAVKFEWIGMNGVPLGMNGTPFEKAALKILEVGSTKNKTEGKLEDVKVEELPPQATETVTVTVTASSVVSEEKKTVVEQTEKSEVITPQTLQEKMHALVKNIPNIQREPLHYVFENLNLRQEPETLWLEFGVFRGSTINYISSHTSGEVYGFDSFLGLPEKWRDGFDKGAFHMGHLPSVHANVRLLKGWFNETLPRFLRDTHPKKISFIHIDCDLYSSTKYVFDLVKDRLSAGSVIVFDELLNYPGFDGDRGELKAFYEFVTENAVKFEWIGMNGVPLGMNGTPFEKAALKILEVGSTKNKTEGKLEDVKVEELPPQATETVTVTVTASSVVSEEKKTVVEQTEKSEVITPQTLQEKMHALVKNIPNIQREPLHYVFENLNLRQEPETLWLEFGVFRGSTINYISSHTSGEVYGFDSFLGLPEKWRDGFDKGAFHMGHLPSVHANVRLLKGWFNETLPRFLRDTHPKKISFIHIDCDLYSSTKYVFDLVKDRLSAGSVIVFDELLNYPGFDGDRGELKAFYEFVTENAVKFEWIGMNGVPLGMNGTPFEKAALKILEVGSTKNKTEGNLEDVKVEELPPQATETVTVTVTASSVVSEEKKTVVEQTEKSEVITPQTLQEKMHALVKNIPNIQREPLHYVFENLNLRQEPETLWLEFGVFRGSTINYISSHTSGEVYGFDSFLGLPEKWRDGFDKGAFHMGHLPSVHANVRLLKGWFNETLPRFLRDTHPKKISFIHIDCDLYSSTKYVFDLVKDRLSAGSVIVFDELLNYPGFDGDRGELKAFYEFVTENAVKFEWIGMNGVPLGMNGTPFEKAALKILEVGSTKNKTEGNLEDVKVEELPPQATETVTVTVTASSVVSEEKKTVVEQTEKSEVITPQTLQEKMHALVKNIPNIQREPLHYVFENLNLRQEPETLWLEFGVFRGSTINYISSHTSGEVYGFDSFLGLPEKWRDGFDKGAFHMGHLPSVHANVRLLKGWFNETLPRFLRDTHPKKISFIHIDCDLYSSTKYVFDLVKDRLSAGSVIVFDELLNYPGFDGDRGELKAFYEFVTENAVKFEWIGMNGVPLGMNGTPFEKAALKILEVGSTKKTEGKLEDVKVEELPPCMPPQATEAGTEPVTKTVVSSKMSEENKTVEEQIEKSEVIAFQSLERKSSEETLLNITSEGASQSDSEFLNWSIKYKNKRRQRRN